MSAFYQKVQIYSNIISSLYFAIIIPLNCTIIYSSNQTRGFFVGVISGHVSVTAMDGTYLGISLINLLGHLPILGITSAIDVLGMRALSNGSRKQVSSGRVSK